MAANAQSENIRVVNKHVNSILFIFINIVTVQKNGGYFLCFMMYTVPYVHKKD